jgi:hypothetical protein
MNAAPIGNAMETKVSSAGAHAASTDRTRLALIGLAFLGVMAVVFSSAARLPFVADDYSKLAVLQQPGWWHSDRTWGVGSGLFRPMLLLWFGLLHGVFGLHPLPFHIASAVIVVIAGVLTGAVARRVGLGVGAYAAIVFYCLHASMTTAIGWAAAANSPLAVALALGALYLMLRPRVRTIDVVGACALFIAALLAREVVAVAPAILLVTRCLVEPARSLSQRLKRSLVVSSPLWLVLVVYAALRRLFGFDGGTGEYAQAFGMHGFTNLGRLLQIATDLEPFSHHGLYSAVVTFLWVALIGLCAMAALRSQRFQGIAGLIWALLAVLPVIFLTNHPMDYYYVDFAIPGLAIAIGTVFEWATNALSRRATTIFAVACFAVFVLVSFNTARVQERAQLGPQATTTAQLVRQVREENPHPTEGSTIIVRGSSLPTIRYLTQQGSLFRVIFDDPTLQVAFVKGKPVTALPTDLVSRIAALRVARPVDDAGFANLKLVPDPLPDANDCNTRCEVLAQQRRTDLPGLPEGGWRSAYDDVTSGDPSSLAVDYLVPLQEAWRSGGDQWDDATWEAFTNDLSSPQLITVIGSTLEARGSSDPATWMPANRSHWCDYVSDWVTVKLRWGLAADSSELSALSRIATTMQCS